MSFLQDIKNCKYIKHFLYNASWLCFEHLRYNTFPDSIKSSYKSSLSRMGFIYCNVENLIVCVYCNTFLYYNHKNPTRFIFRLHFKEAPTCCMFDYQRKNQNSINGEHQLCSYQILFITTLMNSFYEKYFLPMNAPYIRRENRLYSFNRCSIPYLTEQKDKLVDNGFLYIVSDIIQCFYCGGCLYNLKGVDNIPYLHAFFYPECQYLKLMESENTLLIAKTDFLLSYAKFVNSKALHKAKKNVVDDFYFRYGLAMFYVNYIHAPFVNTHELANFVCKDNFNLPSINEHSNDDKEENTNKCIVCLTNTAKVLTLPCKHLSCCKNCIINTNSINCAYCRTKINELVVVRYCM